PIEEYERQMGHSSIRVAIRSNISSTHYFGIASGAGIGLLPTYAMAVGAAVVPLDVDFRAHHDIWLAYHADAGKIPRVRKLIDWLIEAFSPQRFPWFGDEFLHPKDFPKNAHNLPSLDMFSPFTAPKWP